MKWIDKQLSCYLLIPLFCLVFADTSLSSNRPEKWTNIEHPYYPKDKEIPLTIEVDITPDFLELNREIPLYFDYEHDSDMRFFLEVNNDPNARYVIRNPRLVRVKKKHLKVGINNFYLYTFGASSSIELDSVRLDTTNIIFPEESCTLFVSTNPLGSDVILDNKYIGKTPISKKLDKGKYAVEIKKSGYQPIQDSVFVDVSYKNLHYHLKKLVTDTTPPKILIVNPQIKSGKGFTTKSSTKIKGTVDDKSPIKWVRINNNKITIDGKGHFNHSISLVEGSNRIEIKSSDTHGNVGDKSFKIIYHKPQQKPSKTPKKVVKVESRPSKDDEDPSKITITSHDISRVNVVPQNTKRVTVKGKIKDKDGIVEVIVNKKEAVVDLEGNFSAKIYLALGENPVVVTAMDRFENRSSKTFYITRQSSEAVHSSVESKIEHSLKGWYKKQYAVVIGIDRYKDLGIEVLDNAVNDAKAVARMFLKMGFNVTELYNTSATKREILRSFSKTIKSVKKSDSFVFYYAGHGQGFTLESGDRVGYIIPYDAAISLVQKDIIEYDYETIPLNTIKKYVKDMKAKHVALLFDSCFAGLAMKRSFPTITEMDSEYYQDLLSRRVINILTAGDDQPVSDGTGHSPFTRAVLNGLDKRGIDVHDRDGFATFSQLALYVKEKVERATGRRQRPQFDNLSMEDGDFIFKIQ